MKNFLVILAVAVTIAGCRAAVPISFVNKVRTHNKRVQQLHSMLSGYLAAEIAIIDSKLFNSNADKESLLLMRAYLEERLFMTHVDKQFSDWLESWAIRHQWKLAISASE